MVPTFHDFDDVDDDMLIIIIINSDCCFIISLSRSSCSCSISLKTIHLPRPMKWTAMRMQYTLSRLTSAGVKAMNRKWRTGYTGQSMHSSLLDKSDTVVTDWCFDICVIQCLSIGLFHTGSLSVKRKYYRLHIVLTSHVISIGLALSEMWKVWCHPRYSLQKNCGCTGSIAQF